MTGLSRIFPSDRLFLAPMAGITDLPFRTIARQHGCQFAFSEMVNATGLLLSAKSRGYLDSNEHDRPLGVQIFGSDPAAMANAATVVEQSGAGMVDINCGCPVRKVIKIGAGAALMRHPSLIGAIVAAVRRAVTIPVSLKLRSGWDENNQNAAEVAYVAQEAGADMVTVHPRLATQGFSGSADWGVIKAVKGAVKIPVIGNGDVLDLRRAKTMREMTGCDGVMIGRAAWGAPWIFASSNEEHSISDKAKVNTVVEHLRLSCERYGEQKGVRIFRVHLLAYISGRPGSSLLRRAICSLENEQEIIGLLSEFWGEGDGNRR